MSLAAPTATDLDPRFSSPEAAARPWAEGLGRLTAAEVYWLATVRPDGHPHVTPLLAVWLDDALWFCTGPTERKARNLFANGHVALVTGCNELGDGLDVVVEGDAERVTDAATLRPVADAYVAKYGDDWRFEVAEGGFRHTDDSGLDDSGPDDDGLVLVFRVRPQTVFGFGKGEPFSQTRWRF